MAKHSYKWNLQIKGFGPFSSNTKASIDFQSSKVAIYACNGQGKTYLSRMFQTAELSGDSISDAMISRGSKSGTFTFDVFDNNSCLGELAIEKDFGKPATASNTTGYLFHVFNSDYVKANLDRAHYAPSGDIRGYILGESNIDISDKKERLSQLGEEGRTVRAGLDEVVSSAKEKLLEYGVNRRIKEYADITLDYIVNLDQRPDYYDNQLRSYNALQSIPEDTSSLTSLAFNHTQLDWDSLSHILKYAFSHDEFADDFLAEVGKKRSFVSEGMRIQDGSTCPFCGRKYNDDAKALIHSYEEYLAGQEAKTISKLDTAQKAVTAIKGEYSTYLNTFLRVQMQYDELKTSFPDIEESNFPNLPESNEFNVIADSLIEALSDKAADIASVRDASPVNDLKSSIQEIDLATAKANELIVALKTLLSKRSAALLAAKKGLCVELCLKLRNDKAAEIDKLADLRKRYSDLQQEIHDDESRTKRSKRDTVATLFSNLLHEVFGDKYVFDEESFTITFCNTVLGSEAEQVLSDGEKSALAFCFYVASTAEVLNEESDKNKLFFVIDDPISSLDFHYVYGISQIIRDLGKLFDIKRVRLLVLTHNTAFYNLLARNQITKSHYILHDKEISACTSAGIVPYAEHLKDLYDVAIGGAPNHTTGNSIRQVIETLWHFDEPNAANLSAYINTDRCKDLAECEYIYTLCQDQSHGASMFDTLQPIDEASVQEACQAVINHISSQYPGQLIVSGIEYNQDANS